MSVLYLDQTGQLGGGEIALLPWLERAGEDAMVILFEEGPFRTALEKRGVPVRVLTLDALNHIRRESGLSAILRLLPALWRTRARLSRLLRGFDVIYANSQKAFLLAALSRRRGQPLVWHLRDILTAAHFSPLLRRVAVLAGNHLASSIIANSQATADAFVASGGHAAKVTVVHDGVSSNSFDAIDPRFVQAQRAQLQTSGCLLVGVFSRLSPWKGQHIVLEAISQMPGVHVLIVGDALFGEDAYAARLRQRAQEPDLAGRVHFSGFRQDIPMLMRTVDIVIHSSTEAEPFGLVIVEGMLSGRPVIATRAGGAVEILRDHESGLLVTPGSISELKRALERIATHPEFALELAANGRQRALTEFSVDSMIAGIAKVLRHHGYVLPQTKSQPVSLQQDCTL